MPFTSVGGTAGLIGWYRRFAPSRAFSPEYAVTRTLNVASRTFSSGPGFQPQLTCLRPGRFAVPGPPAAKLGKPAFSSVWAGTWHSAGTGDDDGAAPVLAK